jgi:hypothetical protein
MSKDVSKPKVKQAIILVTVHEDGPMQSSVTRPAYSHKLGRMLGLYLVDVYPNDMVPDAKMVDTAAHEFGHVLANIFETPVSSADPRHGATALARHLLDTNQAPPEVLQREVDAEAEAWDFAQKMWADLDPAAREANLDTYKLGIRLWHRSANPEADADSMEAAPARLERLIAQVSRS